MDKNIEKTISLVNSFVVAFSKFDIKALEPLLSDNIIFKNISQGEILEEASNKIEFALILEQAKILFSNRDIKIQAVNIKENIIEVDTQIEATMAISTPDGLRAGQDISYKATLVITLEQNLISKLSLLN